MNEVALSNKPSVLKEAYFQARFFGGLGLAIAPGYPPKKNDMSLHATAVREECQWKYLEIYDIQNGRKMI